MAGEVKVTIEGTADILSYFKSANIKERRASEKAAQAAGRKTKAYIQRRIPSRWKKSMKAKVFRGSKNLIGANVGLYTGHSQGHQNPKYTTPIDDFLKAYWLNYGTMGSRDPSHKFIRPVRKGKQGKPGVAPQNFFEAAAEGWENVFYKAFEDEFNRQDI